MLVLLSRSSKNSKDFSTSFSGGTRPPVSFRQYSGLTVTMCVVEAPPVTVTRKVAGAVLSTAIPIAGSGAADRRDDPLDHAVHRLALMPMPHEHDVVVRVDPDGVGAVANRRETGGRPAGPLLLARVQPPQVAVVRAVRTRLDRVLQPLL